MIGFFDDSILLSTATAKGLYNAVKDLPIVDYHCHLDERVIAEGRSFSDIGELWLSGDHYKWRAMRLCGVAEKYMTGDASYKEKFFKFAEIMPLLAGNPLYYFSHLELKLVFGIRKPLNKDTAEEIWNAANARLKDLNISKLLKLFKVEYIATTDNPLSELKFHGKYGDTLVCPTFRPDAAFREEGFDRAELVKRLDYFVTKGCKISDHAVDFALTGEKAETLEWLAGEYAKRGIVMQLHLGALRDVNSAAFKSIGRDCGYDAFRADVDTDGLAAFFNRLHIRGALPKTVLYSLNPNAVRAMCTISGAFPDVRVGAAWWFNDTLDGIREHLSYLSEYAVLGTCLGMLTDSRSFISYARFDFFRRILADYLGALVEKGEYDLSGAEDIMRRICYTNIKEFAGI